MSVIHDEEATPVADVNMAEDRESSVIYSALQPSGMGKRRYGMKSTSLKQFKDLKATSFKTPQPIKIEQ